MLILVGLVTAAAGALIYLGPRRLPGDIVYRGRNTTVYFPIVTCLALSAGLTLLFWVINYFRR